MPIERIAILGTGLIGASVGLALRAHGFAGSITGWDPNPGELHTALRREAITVATDDPLTAATQADVILLGGPVFTILEWLDRLAPVLRDINLSPTSAASKAHSASTQPGRYNGPGQPGFLPGHPMAGKEVGGAANADAEALQRRCVAIHSLCIGFRKLDGGAGLALVGGALRRPHYRHGPCPPRRALRLDQPSPAVRLHRHGRAA